MLAIILTRRSQFDPKIRRNHAGRHNRIECDDAYAGRQGHGPTPAACHAPITALAAAALPDFRPPAHPRVFNAVE